MEEYLVKFEAECTEDNVKHHKFHLQYYIYEEDGVFIAYCPALDITASGKDLNDVVSQFYEHFQLYVECCIEEGTLIKDLKLHGWKIDGVKIYQPSFEEMLKKHDFRELMESDTEYERRNALIKFDTVTV